VGARLQITDHPPKPLGWNKKIAVANQFPNLIPIDLRKIEV
jgi:hypothetical protein